MRVAIQAADLDADRIDGTRVYLLELLKRFGPLSPETFFHLYHKRAFNPELAPPNASNYRVHDIPFPSQWMQTRFAWEMFRTRPERIFFPVQAVSAFLPKSSEVSITAHDLAFKHFPETFSVKTRFKLNFLLDRAVRRAEEIIAVSEATRADLLHFYPTLDPERIHVIHHGFNAALFGNQLPAKAITHSLATYGLRPDTYILYVGALQPRKNLVRLIQAFHLIKSTAPEARLVLAGEQVWLTEPIVAAWQQSPYREDILLTGKVPFAALPALYQGARCFVFPSLFEGFGIPLLEAFASGTPVLTAANSSLPEVAGSAALFCDAHDTSDLAEKLLRLWQDATLRTSLIQKGRERLPAFSWERCAQETLEYILS